MTGTSDLTLRIADPGDFGRLAHFDAENADHPWTARDFHKTVNGLGVLLVAERSGELKGYLYYEPLQDRLQIERLTVAPAHEHDVAKALVGRLKARLWSFMRTHIVCPVSERDATILQALRELGFKAGRCERSEEEDHRYHMIYAIKGQPLRKENLFDPPNAPSSAPAAEIPKPEEPPSRQSLPMERTPRFYRVACEKMRRLTGVSFELVKEDASGALKPLLDDDPMDDKQSLFFRSASDVAQPARALARLRKHFGRDVTSPAMTDAAPGPVIVPSSWFREIHLHIGADGLLSDGFNAAAERSSDRSPNR